MFSPPSTRTAVGSTVVLLALCLVAVGPAAGTVSADAQTATPEVNRTLEETAVFSAARTADGGLVLGGTSDYRHGNATLTKLAADGSTAWTRRYETENRSSVVAVETGPDGSLYLLQLSVGDSETPTPGSYDLSLARVASDGNLSWRQSLDVGRTVGATSGLAVTETGPALVGAAPDEGGLELTQYGTDGSVVWNRTYDVRAAPRTLTATDDGFLMAGTVGFSEPWVMRTDASGTVTTNRTFETLDPETVAGVVPTDDGFVVAGTYRADFGEANPWAASVGADGVPRWSRVYPTSESDSVQDVLPTEDGFALVASDAFDESSATTFVGVGPDGSQQFTETFRGVERPTVVPGDGRRATLVGWDGYPVPDGTVTSIVRDVTWPAATDGAGLEPDEQAVSGDTYYRGQDLRFAVPQRLGDSFELVAVPGEYDEFEPHVVRRVERRPNQPMAVESATLDAGRYYLRTADGESVALYDDDAYRNDDTADTTFEIEEQSLDVRTWTPPWDVTERLDGEPVPYPVARGSDEATYVDRAAGESGVTFVVDSERADYELSVSADRFRGEQADTATLRAMFADNDAFQGIETVHGTATARFSVDAEENVTVAVDGVDAGLYDLRFRATDTADGGATTETRIVIGNASPRPVSVSLNRSSIELPVDGRAVANVTVDGLSAGVGAMSMSAYRTDQPAVTLSMETRVDATSASAGAGRSTDHADASAQAFDADTPTGTVAVGTLGVTADARSVDPEGPSTNTVRYRIDWIVDENGRPYTVPDARNVTVAVTNVSAATDDRHAGAPAGHP